MYGIYTGVIERALENAAPAAVRVRGAVAGDKVTLTDEAGGTATVTVADVLQSNGVIHVIDHVLLPKM